MVHKMYTEEKKCGVLLLSDLSVSNYGTLLNRVQITQDKIWVYCDAMWVMATNNHSIR